MLAVKLERELPKTEILNRYLNAIYFGRGAYGVEAASKTYFGKDVGSLTLPEAAYLAGLIRSPETADAALPPTDPERRPAGWPRPRSAARRCSTTWCKQHYITQAQRDAAVGLAVDRRAAQGQRRQHLRHGRPTPSSGTQYFVDYVRQHAGRARASSPTPRSTAAGCASTRPSTTACSSDAVDAVTSHARPARGDPSAALVALDPSGRDQGHGRRPDYADVAGEPGRRAAGGGGGRQAGSSFKPFALAEALQPGHDRSSRSYNAPCQLDDARRRTAGDDWAVNNDDERELRRASTWSTATDELVEHRTSPSW